jgi:hypothetical protein
MAFRVDGAGPYVVPDDLVPQAVNYNAQDMGMGCEARSGTEQLLPVAEFIQVTVPTLTVTPPLHPEFMP